MQSYVSYGRCIERVLGQSLEGLFAKYDRDAAQNLLRAKKKADGFTDGSLSNCLVVLQQYYDFLDGH